MSEVLAALDFNRHVQDLRETWQGRLLRHLPCANSNRTILAAAALSILSHNFDDALTVLILAIYPGFELRAPFICSAAKIDKRGCVVADFVMRGDGTVLKDGVVFHSLAIMEYHLRKIADFLKFNDDDRRQLFAAARNWVVADRRLDPAMDPADPDARRLVVH